jgi:hypothetical protein
MPGAGVIHHIMRVEMLAQLFGFCLDPPTSQ